ncbi:MAG TPA: hypothetical protein VM282_05625 [Acidimicrobiales bacterium]|nr:hypothetical protein [Acidimicrobiales bacterium]
MRAYRFLAFAPLALGVVVLVVALLWTEWVWLLYVAALFGLSAGLWRAFSGSWPFEAQLEA